MSYIEWWEPPEGLDDDELAMDYRERLPSRRAMAPLMEEWEALVLALDSGKIFWSTFAACMREQHQRAMNYAYAAMRCEVAEGDDITAAFQHITLTSFQTFAQAAQLAAEAAEAEDWETIDAATDQAFQATEWLIQLHQAVPQAA